MRIKEELKNLDNLDSEILEGIGEWTTFDSADLKDWYYYRDISWFIDGVHYEYTLRYHRDDQPVISIPCTTICDDFAERITDLSIKYGIVFEDHRIWLEDGYVDIGDV